MGCERIQRNTKQFHVPKSGLSKADGAAESPLLGANRGTKGKLQRHNGSFLKFTLNVPREV